MASSIRDAVRQGPMCEPTTAPKSEHAMSNLAGLLKRLELIRTLTNNTLDVVRGQPPACEKEERKCPEDSLETRISLANNYAFEIEMAVQELRDRLGS